MDALYDVDFFYYIDDEYMVSHLETVEINGEVAVATNGFLNNGDPKILIGYLRWLLGSNLDQTPDFEAFFDINLDPDVDVNSDGSYVIDESIIALGTVFNPDDINSFFSLFWALMDTGNTGFLIFESDFTGGSTSVNFEFIHSGGSNFVTFQPNHMSVFFPSENSSTWLFAGTHLLPSTDRIGVVFKVNEADGSCWETFGNSWQAVFSHFPATAVPFDDPFMTASLLFF